MPPRNNKQKRTNNKKKGKNGGKTSVSRAAAAAAAAALAIQNTDLVCYHGCTVEKSNDPNIHKVLDAYLEFGNSQIRMEKLSTVPTVVSILRFIKSMKKS
jgi:hypothetical protein